MKLSLSMKEAVLVRTTLCTVCSNLNKEKSKLKSVSPKTGAEISRLNKIDYDFAKFNNIINKLDRVIHGEEIATGISKPLL